MGCATVGTSTATIVLLCMFLLSTTHHPQLSREEQFRIIPQSSNLGFLLRPSQQLSSLGHTSPRREVLQKENTVVVSPSEVPSLFCSLPCLKVHWHTNISASWSAYHNPQFHKLN